MLLVSTGCLQERNAVLRTGTISRSFTNSGQLRWYEKVLVRVPLHVSIRDATASYTTLKVKDDPFSAVRDCLSSYYSKWHFVSESRLKCIHYFGIRKPEGKKLPGRSRCKGKGVLWSTELTLEKLTDFQQVKKFVVVYRTRKFITVFTSTHQLTPLLNQINPVHTHTSHFRSILILQSNLI